MAITIDWGQKIISIPKADLLLLQSSPTEVRQLNLNEFRLTLKDLEDSDLGMAALTTHNHVAPISVGGVTLERVVEIINGYTVTFEDGQYAVNLVGANSNVGDVVNVNQVSVRSANSAGLVNLDTLLAAAYNGEVCIDTALGQAGTATPLGTRSSPVSNWPDAITIATRLGISRYCLGNSQTLASVTLPPGSLVVGTNASAVTLTIDPSAVVNSVEFSNLTVQGTLDGNNIFRDCVLANIIYFEGVIFHCVIRGEISIAPGSRAYILSCYGGASLEGDTVGPRVNFNSTGQAVIRAYTGDLVFRGYADTSPSAYLEADYISGEAVIESTCTAGLIEIRGNAKVENNAAGATVEDLTINTYILENQTALGVINEGVKKASILVPHTTNVTF